jgi:hypothetical protein
MDATKLIEQSGSYNFVTTQDIIKETNKILK